MDMISKSIKGVVEQGIRSTTAWDTYAFGDVSRSIFGAGTVQQQWEALVRPLDVAPEDTSCRGTVLFVGGGPVALWTAVQIRLLLPTQDILIVEKRTKYTRHHVVQLDAAALQTPLAGRSAVLQKLLANIAREGTGIAIAALEHQLAALASLLGVRVAYERSYPSIGVSNVVAIVGADGAHSTVRRLHFNNAMQTYDGTMYAVELRYDARQATPLSGVQQYALIKAAGRLISEHVSQNTRVSVRLIVTGAEYVAFSGATASAPWSFAQAGEMPPDVLRAMQLWLGARAHYTGEVRFTTSECISSVSLAPYRSVCFSRPGSVGSRRAPVFLVGDAAFGVPFFRALNNGLRCGTALAHVLARKQGEEVDTTAAYEAYVSLLADTEIESVRSKRSMMDVAAVWCNVSARSPLEILAIPTALIEAWENTSLQ